MSETIFVLIVIVTLSGALTTVLAGSIVYALSGLVAAMFGIAGLYIYLSSPFLAMMQILIYVGAVSILIAFAIMLTGPHYRRPREWTTLKRFGAAGGVSCAAFVTFFTFVVKLFPAGPRAGADFLTRDIGQLFFNDLLLPFELISLLIMVAILAAVMLALLSREEP